MAAPHLQIFFTDLEGEVVGTPSNFWDTQVEIPLNDARLASTTVSIYDTVGLGAGGENVTPADRMLKVTYGDHLVFWGQILTPVWDAANKSVQLQAHDPTIRLKRHFHRYGDFAVGTRSQGGYPLNGMGARILVLSSFPTDRQEALGWPHPGIYFGFDSTTDFTGQDGPYPSYPRPVDLEDIQDDEAIWFRAERGANVWDTLQNLTKAVEGFDISFTPCDADHPPQTNLTGDGDWIAKEWSPGFYCQMNCWVEEGNDRTKSNETDHEVVVDEVTYTNGAKNVVFQCGFGRDNLDNFIFRPDAAQMRNYAGVHYPGGQRNKGDRKRMAHAWLQESAARYGQYHEWATADQKLDKPVMMMMAKAYLTAYGFPPTYFDIELSPDRFGGGVSSEEPYRYRDHFNLGDYITAEVKEGELHANLDARIVKITLNQEGNKRTVKTSLECVPKILANLDEITESAE